jgi:hypothetical protein
MKWLPYKRKWCLILLFLIPSLVCAITLLLFIQTQITRAAHIRNLLETTAYTIIPPSQSTRLFCESANKIDNAYVECFFKTDLAHDQIEEYYTNVLSVQGWIYAGTNTVPDTPKNLRSSIYCKGRYTAVISYRPVGYPYSYSLSMSWNIHNCK